jgi:gliding motility-associated protein GldC
VALNKINLEFELDENKIPAKISWNTGNPEDQNNLSKAFFIAFFDQNSRDTLEMDLWTNEMQVIEMDRFVFQILNSLSDMYFRSTKNAELANELKGFINYFGEKTGIINK